MKNIYFYLLLMTSTLIARENPFIASDAYNEEVARLMELNDDYPLDVNNASIQYENTNSSLKMPIMKDMDSNNMNSENIYENMDSSFPKEKIKNIPIKKVMEEKKEVKKVIKKTKVAKKKKVIKKKKRIVKKKKIKHSNEQLIFVKKRSDLPDSTKTYEPLDFLSFTYSNDVIKISSDKYRVFKKFTLDNKIILDFKADNLVFYTQRKTFDTASFKKVTIGNHRNERYFRVVISLYDNPALFKVTHSNDMVSIIRK